MNNFSNDDNERNSVRLAKFLAAAGVASRRNCEVLIQEGRVMVNGVAVTTPAFNVDPQQDQVTLDGKKVNPLNTGRVYLMLNKPAGYTCSAKDDHAKQLVFQLIPAKFGRLFTVGRLDRDSEGLLIVTNDGDYAHQLMHPSRQVTKRYYVECGGQFTTSMRRMMMEGMYDNGEFLRALNVEERSVQRGHCALIFTLGDGRKREVRRLCKDVGLEVRLLRRISVGSLELDPALPPGGWRLLSQQELQQATISPPLPPTTIRPADPNHALPYWQRKRENEERPRRESRDDFKKSAPRPKGRRGDFQDYEDDDRRNGREERQGGYKEREFRRNDEARPRRGTFDYEGNGDSFQRRENPRRQGGFREESSFEPRTRRESFRNDFGGKPRREEPAQPAPRRKWYEEGGEEENTSKPRRNFRSERNDRNDRFERGERKDFGGKERRGGADNDMRFTRGHKYPRNWR